MHEKRFFEWIHLKEKLDGKEHKPQRVAEGDIWWASLGENVGREINGKSDLFSRPVIVIKKLAHGFYFVVPTTTQMKSGSWFVPFVEKGRVVVACLHQARALDFRRVFSKIETMNNDEFRKVQTGFRNLYF